eukprot:CAMPEP_0176092912 /NCGR_PEP_ID=MMETSP0120_2-20121206/46552_1 /TAXON_ID=160619 /ORGANISM="Kryptoperidinium foliaceum, Strain CCMP 1326" /LENGTH=196 /DNA_ID=CAMNT_0017426837 /DNA_START=38 /DNA_END=629 /DNA_ORIENTATION=+
MTRKPVAHRIVFYLLCCLVGLARSEIVSLNDDTFEHQTQASTGATTGSWLIMMGTAAGCDACTRLKPLFEDLGEDEGLYESSIVLGSVDVNESPKTAIRFGIQTIPTLLYLHKKKLYRFPAAKEFVLEHYTKVPAEDIPAPPSAMDQLKDLWKKLQGSGLLFYAFMIMAVMLLGTVGVLAAALTKGGKSKTAAKKD